MLAQLKGQLLAMLNTRAPREFRWSAAISSDVTVAVEVPQVEIQATFIQRLLAWAIQ